MDLQSRLGACIVRWRLRRVSPLSGGFRSEVFACITAGDEEVVLKLTVTTEEAQTEAAALRAWANMGAVVHLIDVDVEHAALLLERIRPATPLPGNDDPVAITVAASLLGTLHHVPPGSYPFPALARCYREEERRAREDAAYEQRTRGDLTGGRAGVQRLEAARALAMRLCATTERHVLLHGDFLDKNLLWNGTRYVAIDPLPRLGDPCSDVGDFAAEHPPASGILSRASAIAARLDLDPQRAQQWAAVWAVLLASAAWRSDQADLEACLASDAFERLLLQ